MQIEIGGGRYYHFQPEGLDESSGKPIKGYWVPAARLSGDEVPEPDIPLNILGSQVEDELTGFKGMAVALTLHISGCVHALIQPKGTQKSGEAIEPIDFDIRRCKGPEIPKLTKEERKESEAAKPSPCGSAYIR
jgi:hypothetical protein